MFSSKSRNKKLQYHDSWKTFFDQPVKSDMRIFDNILKIATGLGDDYTTGYLQNSPYFREHYKITAITVSKQQVLFSSPKTIQQIYFSVNLQSRAKEMELI